MTYSETLLLFGPLHQLELVLLKFAKTESEFPILSFLHIILYTGFLVFPLLQIQNIFLTAHSTQI